jgi:cathepsin L
MKLRATTAGLIGLGMLLVLAASRGPEAGAQGVPAGTAVPPPTNLSFAEREARAAPAIRTQLAQLRQSIAAGHLTYTVGYTVALDRTLAQLTGLRLPADAEARARAWAPQQASLLQRDRSLIEGLIKRGASIGKPITPSFTATSSRADWRTLAAVTPIKDQGNCGSCWAFASLGAYEAAYLIRGNGVVPDTSEQAMLSCSHAGDCTYGGWPSNALTWLVNSTGTDSEPDYPYTASDSPCHAYTALFRASAWGYVNPNEPWPSVAEIKQAMVTYGPIQADLWAASGAFHAYTGGVFQETDPRYDSQGGAYIDHAVVLVGWDDAKQAWILRNSWGTGWGTTADYGTERGYMYIGYGAANIGYQAIWVRAYPPGQ